MVCYGVVGRQLLLVIVLQFTLCIIISRSNQKCIDKNGNDNNNNEVNRNNNRVINDTVDIKNNNINDGSNTDNDDDDHIYNTKITNSNNSIHNKSDNANDDDDGNDVNNNTETAIIIGIKYNITRTDLITAALSKSKMTKK